MHGRQRHVQLFSGQQLQSGQDALAEFEARLAPKRPWGKEKMSEGVMDRMMRGILPFRLDITDVQGTWKLNQNKPADVRTRAATALSSRSALSGPARIASEIRADLAANQQD